jgi:hypothetical protein
MGTDPGRKGLASPRTHLLSVGKVQR